MLHRTHVLGDELSRTLSTSLKAKAEPRATRVASIHTSTGTFLPLTQRPT
jgi:hypothetical protein